MKKNFEEETREYIQDLIQQRKEYKIKQIESRIEYEKEEISKCIDENRFDLVRRKIDIIERQHNELKKLWN